jgi:hypothetical protein
MLQTKSFEHIHAKCILTCDSVCMFLAKVYLKIYGKLDIEQRLLKGLQNYKNFLHLYIFLFQFTYYVAHKFLFAHNFLLS